MPYKLGLTELLISGSLQGMNEVLNRCLCCSATRQQHLFFPRGSNMTPLNLFATSVLISVRDFTVARTEYITAFHEAASWLQEAQLESLKAFYALRIDESDK